MTQRFVEGGWLAPRLSFESPFQRSKIELLRFQQSRHDALGFARGMIAHHPRQNAGDDLPRDAVFVCEPAALALRFCGGEKVNRQVTQLCDNRHRREFRSTAVDRKN